jgi:hypothetical protein
MRGAEHGTDSLWSSAVAICAATTFGFGADRRFQRETLLQASPMRTAQTAGPVPPTGAIAVGTGESAVGPARLV